MKTMAVLVLLGLLVSTALAANQHAESMEDNDFAEFEDTEDDEVATAPKSSSDSEQPSGSPKVVMAPEAAAAEAEPGDDEDATVEQEDEEDFEHLTDEDEFEGFDREQTTKSKSHDHQPPDLKIATVPIHLHTNWDSFYMEMLMLGGLGAYLLNFLAGKAKNNKLAQAWLTAHRQILEENFSVIGDDGTTTDVQSGILMKEAENIYSLWCSGRTCCEGMLVTLKLLKRQDLVSSIARFFRPVTDQIIIKVMMDDADMDSFVFCLATKRASGRLLKDHADLSNYCPDKKSAEKYELPSSFQVMSECPEAVSYILDSKVATVINKYDTMVEYLHFSDQYAGPRQPEDAQTKANDTKKVLIFCFNVSEKGQSSPRDMEQMKPLLQMVFHCIDKMKRFKLTKEAKVKAERSRQKVLESAQKAAHTQRTEAAQARREEKRRVEKEKIMNEDDPDKQRKLEEKNLKKEAKKKQPKVKRMKIKAM